MIEGKAKEPILDFHLFRRRELSVSSIEAILVGVGMFGAIAFIPLYLQGVVGLAASKAGTAIMPMMLAIIIASMVGGQLSSRISCRTIFALGFLLVALGLLLPGVMVSPVSVGPVIAYTVLLGFGIGLIFPTMNTVVQEVFPYKERGVATSAVQFSLSVGAILGIAVAGVILNVQSERLLEKTLVSKVESLMTNTQSSANAAQLSSIIELAKNDPQQLFSHLIDPETGRAVPDQLRAILLPALQSALARSLSFAFFVAMFAAALGIITAFWLGKLGITGNRSGRAASWNGAEGGNAARGWARFCRCRLKPLLYGDESSAWWRTSCGGAAPPKQEAAPMSYRKPDRQSNEAAVDRRLGRADWRLNRRTCPFAQPDNASIF